MAKAKDLKKGSVVAVEGGYWVVEEFHVQHAGRRRPVLHIKLRSMKTGHVVERIFDESDHLRVTRFPYDNDDLPRSGTWQSSVG